MLNYIKSLFGKDELVTVKVTKRTAENRGRKKLSKKQKVLNLYKKVRKLLGQLYKTNLTWNHQDQ